MSDRIERFSMRGLIGPGSREALLSQERSYPLSNIIIWRLRRELQRLRASLAAEARLRFPDQNRLGALKRRKLQVKDRLSSLEAQPA